MKMINLNNISEFKQSYSKALTNGDDMFVFEGGDVLTSYAKYVIEYFNFKKDNRSSLVASIILIFLI